MSPPFPHAPVAFTCLCLIPSPVSLSRSFASSSFLRGEEASFIATFASRLWDPAACLLSAEQAASHEEDMPQSDYKLPTFENCVLGSRFQRANILSSDLVNPLTQLFSLLRSALYSHSRWPVAIEIMSVNKLIGDVVEYVVMPVVMPAVESNLLPDPLVRYGATCERHGWRFCAAEVMWLLWVWNGCGVVRQVQGPSLCRGWRGPRR